MRPCQQWNVKCKGAAPSIVFLILLLLLLLWFCSFRMLVSAGVIMCKNVFSIAFVSVHPWPFAFHRRKPPLHSSGQKQGKRNERGQAASDREFVEIY